MGKRIKGALSRLGNLKVGKVPLLGLFAVAMILLVPTVAAAYNSYLTDWQTRYPSSLSDNNVITGTGGSCALCHGFVGGSTDTSSWNSYGWAIRQQWLTNGGNIPAAIAAIEGFDSDGDPTASTNVQEINANAQPGWTTGLHNTIYYSNGTTLVNQSPPPIANLDPVVVAAPDIDVSSLSLDFGSVTVGNSATLTTTISNVGTASLTVGSLSITGSADFKLGSGAPGTPFTVASGGSQAVPVDYTPSGVGADSGTLVIASDDPDEPTVSVTLSGTGAATQVCDIAVNPLSLDFGTVAVGQTSTMTTTISNTGNADCAVSSLSITGSADFKLGSGAPGTPFTVAPGGSQAVPVDYTPSGVGTDSGTLAIASDDPDESTVSVALSGTGQAQVTDLDVAAFRATHRARLGSFGGITLKLVVKNNGSVPVDGFATIVGTQIGQSGSVEVFRTTVSPINDAVGNGRTTFVVEIADLTQLSEAVPGVLAWTATLDVPGDIDGLGGDTAIAETLIVA